MKKTNKELRNALHLMIAPIVRLLGLKGSWRWAAKEMKKGKMIVRVSTTGSVKYRLSNDGGNRLEWDFHRKESEVRWESAYFFISDMMATNWVVYNFS